MDLLERLVGIFAEHGYASVLVALLLCGAGVPLPEDITLVAGGIIAGLGYANVHAMVGVTMVGVLAGDAAMFLLGHHFGARLLRLPLFAWLLPPARYAKVQHKFERYGNRLMFVARFLPGMRGVHHRRRHAPGVVPALPAARRAGRADQRAAVGVPGLPGCGQPRVARHLDPSRPGQRVGDRRSRPAVRTGAVVAPPSTGLRQRMMREPARLPHRVAFTASSG
jgi:hypothetical protein